MRSPLPTLIAAGLALAAAAPAAATATFYSDRGLWLAAAGGSSFFEDFSGFASDTQFRSAAVALDGMSIQQVGSDSFRNEIDTPPLDFTENDGTSHASMYTNLPDDFPEIEVQITFDQPNLAFGFDSWAAADGEGVRLELYDGVTLIGSADLTNGFPDFLGYVLGGGMTATSVVFASIAADPGFGEGFGIDDLEGLAVPEPASAALLGLGLVALAARRRTR